MTCLLLVLFVSAADAMAPDRNLHRAFLHKIGDFLDLGIFACAGLLIFETPQWTYHCLRGLYKQHSWLLHIAIALLLLTVMLVVTHAWVNSIFESHLSLYPEFLVRLLIGYLPAKFVIFSTVQFISAVWTRPWLRPILLFAITLGVTMLVFELKLAIENIPNRSEPDVYIVPQQK